MKIRTTPLFKVRRLASYTKRAVPVIKHRGRQQLLIRWNLINREKMEREIFNSCIVLKNLAAVHRNMPMSADFILEQLMECSRLLKTTYADILSAYLSLIHI